MILIYLYIPSAKFSESRVSQRVMQGGHNIPVIDIGRRYPRSIRNLFEYLKHCDATYCFDNSQDRILPVFEQHSGNEMIIQNNDTFTMIKEFAKYE